MDKRPLRYEQPKVLYFLQQQLTTRMLVTPTLAGVEKREGCESWNECEMAWRVQTPCFFSLKYDAPARLHIPFPPFASLRRNNLTTRNKTAGSLFECSFVCKKGQWGRDGGEKLLSRCELKECPRYSNTSVLKRLL